MTETLGLVQAGMVGALVGGIFFGGLWQTVRVAVSSRQPALWFLGSIVLRTGVTLAGFYFVSRAHWERLPACLLGFVLIHVSVTLRTRAQMKTPARPAQEAR
jgi:F1F0 ATPase subunit 2